MLWQHSWTSSTVTVSAVHTAADLSLAWLRTRCLTGRTPNAHEAHSDSLCTHKFRLKSLCCVVKTALEASVGSIPVAVGCLNQFGLFCVLIRWNWRCRVDTSVAKLYHWCEHPHMLTHYACVLTCYCQRWPPLLVIFYIEEPHCFVFCFSHWLHLCMIHPSGGYKRNIGSFNLPLWFHFKQFVWETHIKIRADPAFLFFVRRRGMQVQCRSFMEMI